MIRKSIWLRSFLIGAFLPAIVISGYFIVITIKHGWHENFSISPIAFSFHLLLIMVPFAISYCMLMILAMGLFYARLSYTIEDGVFECQSVGSKVIVVKGSQDYMINNSFNHIVEVIFAERSPLFRRFIKWLWDFNGLDQDKIRWVNPESLSENSKKELQVGCCLRIEKGKVVELFPATI